MISALFWDFAQRKMVVYNRRFGTNYRFNLQDPKILPFCRV